MQSVTTPLLLPCTYSVDVNLFSCLPKKERTGVEKWRGIWEESMDVKEYNQILLGEILPKEKCTFLKEKEKRI